uniref:F-box domain-containing protein n=1 Tax=Mycena chlorophos TaxID=658473 RepID=A0ABQ0LAE0_MYCCL|nr:predicted protein [Mycena chlorophos]
MNDPLDASNIQKLPLSLRRQALSALNFSSPASLSSLRALCTQRTLEIYQAPLLPVFYLSLRDSATPTSSELELHLAQNTLGRVLDRPLAVLHRLTFHIFSRIGKAAFQRFWIELWRWLSFLDDHRELLRGYRNADGVLEEYHVSIFLTRIIYPLVSDSGEIYDDIIAPQAGVFTLVARAWRHTAVEAGKVPADQLTLHVHLGTALRRMAPLLSTFATALPLRRDDLIAGLGEGATICDLATLLVSYANTLLSQSSGSDTSAMTSVVKFGFVPSSFLREDTQLVIAQRFLPHLIRAGFLEVLFRVLWAIQAAESRWSELELAGVQHWYAILYYAVVLCNKVPVMAKLIRNRVLDIILRAVLLSDRQDAKAIGYPWFAAFKNYLAYGRVVADLGPTASSTTRNVHWILG